MESGRLGRVSGLGGMLSRLVQFVMAPAEDPRASTASPFGAHEELLEQLRNGRAQVTEAERRLQSSRTKLEAQVPDLVSRARAALTAGQEETARQLLRRKQAVDMNVAAMASREVLLREEADRLTELDLQLTARLETIRAEHEIDLMRQEIQQRVGDALAQISQRVTQATPLWLPRGRLWDGTSIDISAFDRLGGLLEATIDPYEIEMSPELARSDLEDELQLLRQELPAR